MLIILIIKNVQFDRIQAKGKAKYLLSGKKMFAEEAAQFLFEKEGYSSIWSENTYWSQLLALLFWDVIFAKVPEAMVTANKQIIYLESEEYDYMFEHFFQLNGMPADLFSKEFYLRRKSLIDNRIKELEQKDIAAIVKNCYSKYYSTNCRLIENWKKFSLKQLLVATNFLSHKTLLNILERLLLNFKDFRSGLPDLLAYKQNEILFIEVKSKNDKMSEKQREWQSFLEVNGENYILFLINHSNKQISNIKKKFFMNGYTVKISFGNSTGKYREQAIDFVKQQDTFFTRGEGKNKIYGAEFNIKEIDKIYTLLDWTGRWKSQKIEIGKEVISSTQFRNSLYCFHKKNKLNASIDYCKISQYNHEKNEFGCNQVNIDLTKWKECGYVDTDTGEWIFNEDELNTLVDKIVMRLKFCPLFDPDMILKKIGKMPAKINPKVDKNWGFISVNNDLWYYDKGNWKCNWVFDEKFPGIASMVGIKKITRMDRASRNYGIIVNVGSEIAATKGKKRKSGCFIATAVYGSYNSPEVKLLRKFRDEILSNNIFGRLFIKSYYIFSPLLADYIINHKRLKNIIKQLLDKVVVKLNN